MTIILKRVCVFCGSNPGNRPDYLAAARQMGNCLASGGIELVYGGGCVGLMGALADAVLQGGGHVIGVIPRRLVEREVAHKGLSDLRIVESMHERKALMADLADAFVALPGGFGTFEEFCEVLTWSQLGLHKKPCGLLNVGSFYTPFLALIDHATAEGFIVPQHRALVLEDTSPSALLDRLSSAELPAVEKWIGRSET